MPPRDILAQAIDKLPIALCIIDRKGRLVAVNALHATLAGREVGTLAGARVAELHPEGGENVMRDFRAFDQGKTVPNHEIEIGGRVYMVSVSPIHDDEGWVTSISVAHFDITEKKNAELKMRRLNQRLRTISTTDHLTKLANRRSFDLAIRDHVDAYQRRGTAFGLVLFDVDHFKPYNDFYGHLAGDRCLNSIAQSARAATRRLDTVLCRYGGEEFAVLVTNAGQAVAARVAERIRQAVERLRIPHAGSEAGCVTISAGVAGAAEIGREGMAPDLLAILMKAADDALYTAKKQGRNTVWPSPVA